MTALALKLQVFISSPSDVQPERDAIDRVVLRMAREAARQNLLLTTYRFEYDAIPSARRPLDHSNVDLRESELVIAVLGKGVGSPARPGCSETGTMEELRIAKTLIEAGRADELFLYYRSQPDSGAPIPSLAGVVPRLLDLRDQILWPYVDHEMLEPLVERHLRRWLEKWSEVPEICRRAFESPDLAFQRGATLGEDRLANILRHFDWGASRANANAIGTAAARHYQTHGPAAVGVPLNGGFAGLRPLVVRGPDGAFLFAHDEAFYFLCAVGLAEAIRNNDPAAVERYPYPNEVHQYLSAIVLRDGDTPRFSAVLCDWLGRRTGAGSLPPTARNFAAYVLGMIDARGAMDQLADSLESDRGEGVRTYCITSLGKLRARRHLSLLRREFRGSTSSREQELIAKAVCRIVGIAHFEL